MVGIIQELFILIVVSRTEGLFYGSSESHFSRSLQTYLGCPHPSHCSLHPLPGMPSLILSFQPNLSDTSKNQSINQSSLGPSRKSSKIRHHLWQHLGHQWSCLCPFPAWEGSGKLRWGWGALVLTHVCPHNTERQGVRGLWDEWQGDPRKAGFLPLV